MMHVPPITSTLHILTCPGPIPGGAGRLSTWVVLPIAVLGMGGLYEGVPRGGQATLDLDGRGTGSGGNDRTIGTQVPEVVDE